MTTYSIFELNCSHCGVAYAQVLPDEADDPGVVCPSCGEAMAKGAKMAGDQLLSCGWSPGGG